jgi:hypothetical protein
MKTYPKGAVKIYDNGGKTFDRYTAVFMDQPERAMACLRRLACRSILSTRKDSVSTPWQW